MNRNFVSAVFVVSLMAAPIAAQTAAKPLQYDLKAEVTLIGTVKSVIPYVSPDGTVGVHLEITTEDRVVSIHIGPAQYLGSQNFYFLMNDEIVVTGARVRGAGNASIWAKSIQKGTQVLILRGDDGSPKWTALAEGTDGCGVDHAQLPRATEDF